MYVTKRDGRREEVAFEKVQQRIAKAANGLSVNVVKVAQGVLTRIVDGITTTELDTITANLAYSWSTLHPDYADLAAQIAISSHQKNTPSTFLEVIERLEAVQDRSGHPASLLAPEFVKTVRTNAAAIEAHIQYDRDFGTCVSASGYQSDDCGAAAASLDAGRTRSMGKRLVQSLRDVRSHVAKVLYARYADSLQFGHETSATEFLLSASDEG